MRRLRRAYQRHARQNRKFKRLVSVTQLRHRLRRRREARAGAGRAVAAGTAIVITLGTGVSLNKALAHTPDPHELPVIQDVDVDLLANREEFAIGYQPFNDDQNKNGIPDGVELAKRCVAYINELPVYSGGPEPNEIYKIECSTWGLEDCHICGETLNMGGIKIVNPKLGLNYPPGPIEYSWVFLPYMSLHYMEHGSFSFSGTTNSGRVVLPRLLRVLELRFPYDPNDHQLPLDYVVEPVGQLAPDANDLDSDLLADTEELAAGYDLHDADQDDDLLPDGVELAKQCAGIINELPWKSEAQPGETYKWHIPQKGLDTCIVCGATVNMGPAGIVNPKLGLDVSCPLIAIHYMKHGSFSYHGSQNIARIDIPQLVKVLEMPHRCGDLGTLYLPGDLNRDCQENFADFADVANKWLDSTEPN